MNRKIEKGDPEIGEESRELAGLEMLEIAQPVEEVERELELESIVMRSQRPVLAIMETKRSRTLSTRRTAELWKDCSGRSRYSTAPFTQSAGSSLRAVRTTGSGRAGS